MIRELGRLALLGLNPRECRAAFLGGFVGGAVGIPLAHWLLFGADRHRFGPVTPVYSRTKDS